MPVQETRLLREKAAQQERLAAAKAAEDRLKSQRSFDYVEAIGFSFFSRYFYRDVLRRWNGWGILYIAFVSAVWMVPAAVGMQLDFGNDFEKDLVPIIRQMPHLTVGEGLIRYEGPDPHVIRESKKNQIVAFFTRAEGLVDFANIPAWYVIAPTQLAMKETTGAARVFGVSPKVSFTVTADIVLYWARQTLRWAAYLMYPFMWMSMILLALLAALFYALFGKIVAFFLKIPSDFQNLYRLTLVAFTPSLFLIGLAMLWDSPGDCVDWASVIAPLIFIFVGLWHNREPRKKKAAA